MKTPMVLAAMATVASAYYSDRLNDFGTLSEKARHSKVKGLPGRKYWADEIIEKVCSSPSLGKNGLGSTARIWVSLDLDPSEIQLNYTHAMHKSASCPLVLYRVWGYSHGTGGKTNHDPTCDPDPIRVS